MTGWFEESEPWRRCAAADPPLPRILQLELTADCNFRCVFCPLQSEPRQRRGADRRIAVDDLDGPLREALDAAYEVELTGFGEIFCHPDLLAALRRLKARGLTVNATSNGALWTRDALQAIVAERLIDLLCVSLDAGSAEAFARFRAGGDWGQVVANLRLLNDIKAAGRSELPALRLSFLATRDNLPELPAVAALAADIGAREVIVQGLFENAHTAGLSAAADERAAGVYARAADVARTGGVHLEFWYQASAAAPAHAAVRRVQVTAAPAPQQPLVRDCAYPWERVFVKSNLDVQACATVWEDLVMGNLRRQPLRDIWRGPAYRELRQALAGPNPPAPCRRCHTKAARAPLPVAALGDAVDFGAPQAAQAGPCFQPLEFDRQGRGFRWSAADAAFFLRNTGRPFLDLEVIAPPGGPPRRIAVTLNGGAVDDFAAGELPDPRVRLAAPPLAGELLECHISVTPAVTAADLGYSPSRRPLGLMFYRAALAGDPAALPREFRVDDAPVDCLGRGFFPPEAGLPRFLRWTGERASFVLADGAALTIVLENVPPTRGRRVEIADGGEPLGAVRLPRRLGSCELRVPLPGRKAWRAISLRCEPWTPGGGDPRSLGVLFRGARVEGASR